MGFLDLLEGVDRSVRSELDGRSVIYTPSVGDPVTVAGIFDAAYEMIDVGRAGVSGYGPAVFLRLSELSSDPSEDNAQVTVEGTDYKFREVKPDGLGGVWILLHEAD